MEFDRSLTTVSIAANTEVAFCVERPMSYSSDGELNGFGRLLIEQHYPEPRQIQCRQLTNMWLLFTPNEQLQTCRDEKRYNIIPFEQHKVTLAFGALTSPSRFTCAASDYVFQSHPSAAWTVYFAKRDAFVSISTDCSEFKIKSEHIDTGRGILIDASSNSRIGIYICLRGSVDEYIFTNQGKEKTRRFYRQQNCNESWQPCFSTLHLLIHRGHHVTKQIVDYFIQFSQRHSIPIHLAKIKFFHDTFIDGNHQQLRYPTFISTYALAMLESVGCRMHDQLMNKPAVQQWTQHLLCSDNDPLIYFTMERLRRLALHSEHYFMQLEKEIPIIQMHYRDVYLQSIYHLTDQSWANYVRIPWFCVTPTRLIAKPWKFMRSNRVFRMLSNLEQCMAFVEFRDETGSAFLSEELAPFLMHYLEHGLHFAGRHYQYLHHAQSQVRNKQFYFFCEEEGRKSRETVEDWMGDFDGERLPAKNTARRTQPFSSTQPTIEIDPHRVDTIPDLKTPDGKYNFTDGVGQISSELNRLVHEALDVDVDNDGYISSVLQIRYGGCKGTVAANPELDGQEKQLLIRPSMNKFKCQHRILEICKRSLRRRLFLNLEVINLLTYRGISATCLRAFQLQNIQWLISSLLSSESAVAILREKSLNVLPWANIARHPQLFKETFFRRLLQMLISNNLHQLVTRAHIRVPKARYMFGVVDEYALLEAGQVFVQITNEDGSQTVLEGRIAITKNPCHHPGDLRVLQAVDHPRLHHLYDVLVFPQQGFRPHASEISGSDLDGDEYTVIWDSDLVPTSENPAAFDYDSGPAPTPLDRVVRREDRLEVIHRICEQDNLGRLSIIHLVLVDQLGIDSNEAISLAGGLSQELDSVKSGQHPYTSEEIQAIIAQAHGTRPDFMQATDYETYPSKKVLGKLFRSAQRLSDVFSNSSTPDDQSTSLDPLLLHAGYEGYIDFARQLYQEYQSEVSEILGSFGFANEVDLFCCAESRSMSTSERGDTLCTVQYLLKAVFRYIRAEFRDDSDSFRDEKAKAAACYFVAYTDQGTREKRMLSFPWLFASTLLVDYPVSLEDEIASDWNLKAKQKLQKHRSTIKRLLSGHRQLDGIALVTECFEQACRAHDEDLVELGELLLVEWIKIAINNGSN